MPAIVILGAGPIGATIAHRLAQRSRVNAIVVVDDDVSVAAGKALDIVQSGPVDRFDVRVTASGDPLTAVGAAVVVVADSVKDGEWDGDRGLELIATIDRAGCRSPVVFVGARHLPLMERAARAATQAARRLVATAPAAAVGSARALASAELQLSDVDVTVVGRPPGFVTCWSTAITQGTLVAARVPGHRLLALSAAVNRLWPPGPHALAAASVPVIEALVSGARRLVPAATIVDGDLGARGKAVLLPLEIVPGGVKRFVLPSLSPQERTELITSIS